MKKADRKMLTERFPLYWMILSQIFSCVPIFAAVLLPENGMRRSRTHAEVYR
jgi:hypothetical protein